jgi:hypothetical protein
MAPINPMIPSRRALEKGLYELVQDIASSISFAYDHALYPQEIHMAALSIATYLNHYIARNRRRATTPLNHTGLTFKVTRTNNPKEDVFDDKRIRTSKGKKEWYYISLIESEKTSGGGNTSQILAEGDLRKNKAELFDAFIEMVERRNSEWDAEDERKRKDLAEIKKADEAKSREEEIALREIAKIEASTKKHRGKGKGEGGPRRVSQRKTKVKMGDLVDPEDLEDE